MKTLVRILVLLCLSLGPSLSVARGQDVPAAAVSGVMTEGLLGDPTPRPVYVPPPPLLEPGDVTASTVQSLAITVNYNPTGTGRCEVAVTPWPPQARTAVDYAMRIWSSLLGGTIPIVVDVCWTTLGGNLLAQGGPSAFYQNFTGAPQSNTLYPIALANQLSASDLNGAGVELQMRFNSAQSWYSGTNGLVPAGQFDLVSATLHELGHAIGFAGTMNWDNGAAPNECDGTNGAGCYGSTPDIYDRFTQNTGGQSLLALPNNTVQLGNQLIGNALIFGGPNATAVNGNAAPRLHAPNAWVLGRSHLHLDEATFNNTTHALMTPEINTQEAIHHPGEVMLGVLRDLGWRIRDFSVTFVNHNNTDYEDGSALYPFNTAEEGVNAVAAGGTIYFVPGDYPGQLTIDRTMVLQSPAGTTVLGAP